MTAVRLVASALALLLALPLGAAAQGSARPLLKKYGPPTKQQNNHGQRHVTWSCDVTDRLVSCKSAWSIRPVASRTGT